MSTNNSTDGTVQVLTDEEWLEQRIAEITADDAPKRTWNGPSIKGHTFKLLPPFFAGLRR